MQLYCPDADTQVSVKPGERYFFASWIIFLVCLEAANQISSSSEQVPFS